MLQVLICLAIIITLFEIARGEVESAVARPMPELRKLNDGERVDDGDTPVETRSR
jgi:hypothetical protein